MTTIYEGYWDVYQAHPSKEIERRADGPNKYGRIKPLCPVCGKMVTSRGLGQHLDWHVKRGDIKIKEVTYKAKGGLYDFGDGTFRRKY